MEKASKPLKSDDMRPEYDFSGGVRGKYANRFAAGTNVILLEPDLAVRFPDSKSVNEALRTLVRVAGKTAKLPRKPAKRRHA
ncbi:MAG: hypothetical protein WC538_19760 [Thermoanaerobaculia bacterium]